MSAFPEWRAGQIITADDLNSVRLKMAVQVNSQVSTSTTLTDSEVVIPVEAGAVYSYRALIAFSATTASDFSWAWAIPSGATLARWTISVVEALGSGNNTGGAAIMRSPAATTQVLSGGNSTSSPPANFQCVYDQGYFEIGGTPGNVVLQFAQGPGASTSDQTILLGSNRTRVFYQRVA